MNTLPNYLKAEFLAIYEKELPIIGMIAARNYALSTMLTKRRASLAEHLDAMPTSSCDAPWVTHEITRFTAELTLLLIERGA